MSWRIALFFWIFLAASPLHAAILMMPTEITLSHERLSFQESGGATAEMMGLTGVSYQLKEDHGWTGGISWYGATEGRRGGFFVLGPSLGYELPISGGLNIKFSYLAGGGGGGSAPQGGGLMLREGITLFYPVSNYQVGLGYTRIIFPNGGINSQQGSVQLKFHSNLLQQLDDVPEEAHLPLIFPPHWQTQALFFLPFYKYYDLRGMNSVSGTPLSSQASLFGIGLYQALPHHFSLGLETAAAASGGVAGYMTWSVGLAYHHALTPQLYLVPYLNLGTGGGGSVNTGGGLLGEAGAYLDYSLSPRYSLRLGAGYLTSAGTLSIPTFTLAMSSHATKIHYDKVPSTSQLVKDAGFKGQNLELSGSIQRYYFAGRNIAKKGGSEILPNVDLMGVQVEVPSSLPYGSLQLASYWAYEGGCGGYAAGLGGLVLRYPLTDRLSLKGKVNGGVGAGGGMPSGDGLLILASGGLTFSFIPNLILSLETGELQFLDGVNAPISEISLSYHLHLPTPQE